MKVERKGNDIVIRFDPGTKISRIQGILDYLRYEELTSRSEAAENDVEYLTQKAKKGRWNRIKDELGFDD